jgi:hypothetical protein
MNIRLSSAVYAAAGAIIVAMITPAGYSLVAYPAFVFVLLLAEAFTDEWKSQDDDPRQG